MAAAAHKLGPGILTFGSTGTEENFAQQCSNVRLEPSVDAEDPINVLSGEELAGDETVAWILAGTLYQRYDAEALQDWCFTNRLTTMPFTFLPTQDAVNEWKGQCRIVPITIGGDVKVRNTSDFEFQVIGEPSMAPVV